MNAPGRMIRSVEHDGVRDEVAVEEPLEIRVDGAALAVTMRTPGHDEELALGFLYGEGLIDEPREAGPTEDFAANIVEVEGPLLRDVAARRFYTTSSCGVCGRGALEEVAVYADALSPGPTVDRGLLADLPERLRQPTFARTGGLHATGLFTPSGSSPSSSARPITLSMALWRPTSSRTMSGSPPPRANRPVACSPPVRSNTGCRSRSGSVANSARGMRRVDSTRGECTATSSSAPLPQMPQDELV